MSPPWECTVHGAQARPPGAVHSALCTPVISAIWEKVRRGMSPPWECTVHGAQARPPGAVHSALCTPVISAIWEKVRRGMSPPWECTVHRAQARPPCAVHCALCTLHCDALFRPRRASRTIVTLPGVLPNDRHPLTRAEEQRRSRNRASSVCIVERFCHRYQYNFHTEFGTALCALFLRASSASSLSSKCRMRSPTT